MSTSTIAAPIPLMLLALVACKPSDEPPRDPAGADEGSSGGAEAGRSGGDEDTAPTGTIRLTAPEPTTPDESASEGGAPDVDEDGRDEDAAAEPTHGLSEALVAELRAPVSAERRERARELSRKAARLHRKLEIPAAVEAYEGALEAWPGHAEAHYDLARAQALRGEPRAALRHLRMVAVIEGEGSERLRTARVEPDLEVLRGDADFRALTGYAPVRVTRSPELDHPKATERVADTLREANLPAEVADEPWPEETRRTTLLVRRGDVGAASAAAEVLAALDGPVERSEAALDPGGPPLVLVLGTDSAAAGIGDREPTDFVGRALVARHEGVVERLRLERTGFFSWERFEDDGRRVERTGRYHLENDALSLSFRQVSERPRPGAPPAVEVEQGRRSSHEVRVEDGALILDGRSFSPER